MIDDLRGRFAAAGRWCFGDRRGLVLWLGLVCWFGLIWRVGFFIQDTYALANTLVALADGKLHVTELRYSLTFGSQPGLYERGGRLYGRNYGQLALAVPLVWILEGLATVAAPRLLLSGLWAGLGLALVVQIAEFHRLDRQRTRAVGALVVALAFAASVLTATDLPRDQLALVALQLSTILAAATAGLVLYRLVSLLQNRRLGVAAGVALGVATPVGFWATLPKRHTVVATLVLAAVYAFAVSRHREGDAALRARAGAYALAGYITWIHAFEALFVVAALGAVDLLTARRTGVRELLVIGLVLLAASTPMLATNYAVTGSPAEPPRMLSSIDAEFSPGSDDTPSERATDPANDTAGSTPTPGGGTDTETGTPAPGGGTDTETGTPGGGGDTVTPAGSDSGQSRPSLFETARSAVETVSTFAAEAVVGGVAVLGQPDRLWHTFVRSGTIPSVNYGNNDAEAIELALLEAMPLLGALAALPVLAGRRLRRALGRPVREFDPRGWTPARKTDLLVVTLAVVLTVVYLPRLPFFSMLTVRYLHPVIPLAAYGVCRIPAVRTAVADSRWLGGGTVGSLAFALVVLLGGITGLDLAVGEAVQYTALWSLASAVICAGVVVGRTVRPDRIPDRVVSVGVALPAGFTAAFLLLAGLVYFRYGRYAFDLVALVADALPAL